MKIKCHKTGLDTHSNSLFLDASYRQNFACEGDLSSHGHILADGLVHTQGQQGSDNGTASTGAILRSGTLEREDKS